MRARSVVLLVQYLVIAGACSEKGSTRPPGISPLDTVLLSRASASLKVGESLAVAATVRDSAGEIVEDAPVSFILDGTSALTVAPVNLNTIYLKAFSAGSGFLTALATRGTQSVSTTIPVSATVDPPAAVTPLFVLDPCAFADSAAMWQVVSQVSAGTNTGSHRPTIDATVGTVPWDAGCNKAFIHRYNFLHSSTQSAYDWTFAGSAETTKRVWYRIWVKMSDSLRVAADWKTMFLFSNNDAAGNNFRYRVTWGHSAAAFTAWTAGTISTTLNYGYQLTEIPVSSSPYYERGEVPPKGEGRHQGTGGHVDAEVAHMRSFAFTGQWRLICVYQTLPSAEGEPVVMRVWNNGILTNDSDSSAVRPTFQAGSDAKNRFFTKFSFGRNGELFFVKPATNEIVRQTAYVHTGRVEIFNQKPATGCG